VLRNTVAVANMIREEKTFQIPSAMQIGKSQGMQTFDEALKALVTASRISGETAYRAASKKEEFESFLPGGAPAASAEARKP
jgi:twitching motility protein PilT